MWKKRDPRNRRPEPYPLPGLCGRRLEAAENVVVKVQAGPSYSMPDKGDSKMQPYLISSVAWQGGSQRIRALLRH